jgi:hypothetical protein
MIVYRDSGDLAGTHKALLLRTAVLMALPSPGGANSNVGARSLPDLRAHHAFKGQVKPPW